MIADAFSHVLHKSLLVSWYSMQITRTLIQSLNTRGEFRFFSVTCSTLLSQTVETMSAGVLYLSEVVETTHEEIPDYGPEKFFADIGGAAGLVLGMSVATLAGIIGEYISTYHFLNSRVELSTTRL